MHLCRYTREIQSHRPAGLRVSFWPQDNLRVEDMPSLQTYRSSALAPLMFALLADAPRGHPLPHVAEFPGPLEHQAGEKVFSSTSAEFPLASYEILVGLERRREVRGGLRHACSCTCERAIGLLHSFYMCSRVCVGLARRCGMLGST